MSATLDGFRKQTACGIVPAVCGIALLAVLAACVQFGDRGRLPSTLTGRVSGPSGPVAGAIVQLQGTATQVRTDAAGRFTLHGQGLGGSQAVTVTAWADEHFIAWTTVQPGAESVGALEMQLKPLFDVDNHEYTWFSFEGTSGSASCGLCHREYKEWQGDPHSQSAVNPRFISMFRGTDVNGRKGQPTQFVKDGVALSPDPALPHYGPGFRLDNPEQAGTCAACHTPAAAPVDNNNTCAWSGCHTSLTAEKAATQGYHIGGVLPVGNVGIGEEGVACEFCHVVAGSLVDPQTGLPPADQPGVMSLDIRRPPNGEKQFLGTLIDSSREVSYEPFLKESQFCASCHFGVFGGVVSNMKMTGGTVIYNSFGEWKDSPYSDPQSGRTCQDCHMVRRDTLYSVLPERGGVARDYVAYHDHTMLGPSTSRALMWDAVAVTPTVTIDGDGLRAQVEVFNDNTGHAVPTDAPMRSVMLVVEARDANGELLPLREGPTLPEWTGDQAGKPGRAFARILKDNWTGEAPTAAFWRQTTVLEDTRLFPFTGSRTEYTFALPDDRSGPVVLSVRLVYRRAFQALAQQKGWTDPDIVMFESVTTQAIHFSNAKRAIPSPFGGRNSAFRGKY